jgi:hypothetical protein
MSEAPAERLPPAIDDEIHGKLVRHPRDDVQGLLAYGIFKQSERDWITRFHGTHGRAPNAHEVATHFYFSYEEGDIERLRTEAESKMTTFALAILDDERPGIESIARKAAHDEQLALIRQEIRRSGGFWRAIWAGVISSFVFAVVTLALVAAWYAPGLRDILKGMTH